ncbi:hypothetical protein D3C81_1717860 [compost metagenome]
MYRLHKADIGVHSLLVRRNGIGDQRGCSDGILNGIEQRQAGEHPDGQLLFLRRQRGPRGNIVRQRHLLRQPEVGGQTVPHLQILVVFDDVPVDCAHQLHRFNAIHNLPHSAQDTQPCTSVPSNAIWRRRM